MVPVFFGTKIRFQGSGSGKVVTSLQKASSQSEIKDKQFQGMPALGIYLINSQQFLPLRTQSINVSLLCRHQPQEGALEHPQSHAVASTTEANNFQ